MARIGVICPDLSGHLNPMMAVARELGRRGYRVVFYQRLIVREKLEGAGFEFRAFGEQEFSIEQTQRQLKRLAEIHGLAALKLTVNLIKERADVCMRDVPGMARADGIDALIVDQATPEGGTIAEELGVPFATACNALMLQFDERAVVPPFCFGWRSRDAWWARWRNRLARRMLEPLARPLIGVVNARREALGFAPIRQINDAHSPRLLLAQQPREFEYPWRPVPAQLHFTGPLSDPAAREPVAAFPFERLDGRPLVYASLGTMQNRQFGAFRTIAQACAGLGVQLVISLGGGAGPEALGPLPGEPIVVGAAPQLAILPRAAVCVTHAGLNTTLESLANGVPMVAIPITNDQPGVAARIAWTGTGIVLNLHRLGVRRLREAIRRVLEEPAFADNARRLQGAITRSGGTRMAADLIEQKVLGSGGGTLDASGAGITSGDS